MGRRGAPGLGVEREANGAVAERIDRILKREDFEDHWQALVPLSGRPTPRGCVVVDRGSVDGLGLAEAIEALRDELLKARAAGAAVHELLLHERWWLAAVGVGPGESVWGRPSRPGGGAGD
jgi:hypothetical protein